MKRGGKVLLFLIGIVLAAYISFWIFVNLKGNKLLEDFLRPVWGEQFTVSSVSLHPFFNFEVKGISAKNISLKDAHIAINLFKSFKGKLYFDKVEIQALHLQLYRKANGGAKSRDVEDVSARNIAPQTKEGLSLIRSAFAAAGASGIDLPFFIRKIKVINSAIDFFDENTGVVLYIDNINLEAVNISPEFNSKIRAVLKANIKSNTSREESIFKAEGNIFLPNEFVKARINIANIDYFEIAKYLPPDWSPQNIGLEKAFFSLGVDLDSKDNMLLATFSVFINDYKFKELENPPSSKYYMLKSLMSIFRNRNSQPLLRFSIKLPFDKLNLPNIEGQIKKRLRHLSFRIAADAITADVEDTVKTASKVAENTVKKTLESPEEVVDMIKEIKDEFERAFSK